MEKDDDSYDFDNWHQNVPADEDELKRKLKKKRKAEHKKIREEARKKKEEEERKKEGEDESSDEDSSEVDEEQAKRERRKEKREKKKEKKKEKKEKKRKREEAEITGEPLTEENDNSNKKHKKEGNGKRGEFGIWVGNLAFSTTEEMLKKFFADCGTITRINLPINKKTKNNKGFAYIDFEDEESMKNAVALSEQTLENRNLLIKSSKDFRGRPAKTTSTNTNNANGGSVPTKGGNKSNTNNKKESPTLFVGNLPFAATADGISKLFKEFGEISNVRVATFEDNQEKCKGFAYVDFANIDSAIKAMNSGKKPKLLGRVLRIEYAGDDATRRGYNRLHKKSKDKDNAKETKPAEPKPIAIAKWDGELVTFKGQKTVFDDNDD